MPSNQRDQVLGELEREAAAEKMDERIDAERYAFLDWNEIREMARGGIEFGSHTVHHAILSTLDPEQRTKEIAESERQIEDHLGIPCLLFAYPNGTRADFGDRAEVADWIVGHFKEACMTRALSRDYPPAVVIGLGVPGLGIVRSLSQSSLPVRVPIHGIHSNLSMPTARTRLCRKYYCEDLGSERLVEYLIDIGPKFVHKPLLFLSKDTTVLTVSRNRKELWRYYRFVLPQIEVPDRRCGENMIQPIIKHITYPLWQWYNGYSDLSVSCASRKSSKRPRSKSCSSRGSRRFSGMRTRPCRFTENGSMRGE